MRFGSPIARSSLSQLLTEVPRPATFHLQVFSTSWRFTPQITLWPCFIPLALVGFALQSVPLKGSTLLSSSSVSSNMSRLDFHLYQPA